MSAPAGFLADAMRVADAILYEGYLLYPYRGSARKNQSRFQFGVLMPPAYRDVDDCEPSASHTECLLECPADAAVTVFARFLHLQRRQVEAKDGPGGFRAVASVQVDGAEVTTWDEAAEREHRVTAPIEALLAGEVDATFAVPGSESFEALADRQGRTAGRLARRRAPLAGAIRLRADRLPGPYGGLRLEVTIENRTSPDGPLRRREDGLRQALIAAHALIHVPGGRFLSLTDPPEWAQPHAAACVNTGTWPVLAGPEECRELVLSSPVILYDHPRIAAESAGELFDSTEIDEILTLRTLALTDEEKREARATDPRAAALLDRLDDLPPEMLERMHGAIRYLGPPTEAGTARPGTLPEEAVGGGTGPEGTGGGGTGLQGTGEGGMGLEEAGEGGTGQQGARPASATGERSAPWWDPGADTSVSPESDHILIRGVRVARGSRVRMRPGARRADAQDLFLTGRSALVEAVLYDVDGNVHLAVTPEDDPAADLQRSHGRFLYFAPDEVEPIGVPT
ncbi:MAG TPA: hypothetical protein VKD66_08560 [Streptosporangiaceae bacterium]|nr:hypothetical protein [Streptosporangiaceae bacterium]